jgi:peptide/nickel transport system ATP-binding protein
VTVQQTILDLMLKLQQENDMGILFITHDLGCDSRTGRQSGGDVQGQNRGAGPGDGDISRTRSIPYTKGLLACRPPLEVRLKRLACGFRLHGGGCRGRHSSK